MRRLVVERAGGVCEYCLIDQEDTYFGCEIEHVISEKHGGATAAENLAVVRAWGSDYDSRRQMVQIDYRRMESARSFRVAGHWYAWIAFLLALAPWMMLVLVRLAVPRYLRDGSDNYSYFTAFVVAYFVGIAANLTGTILPVFGRSARGSTFWPALAMFLNASSGLVLWFCSDAVIDVLGL